MKDIKTFVIPYYEIFDSYTLEAIGTTISEWLEDKGWDLEQMDWEYQVGDITIHIKN